MTWDDWARAHRETFGWHREELLATLVRWARLFERGGYTPEEMAAATERVALDAPQYPDAHLRGLMEAARAARARAAAGRRDDAAWSDCPDCGGAGLVPVPSWKPFERRWGEACCCCTCAAGQRRAVAWEGYRSAASARGARVAALLPLDVYDAEHPGWRGRLAGRRRQVAEELAEVRQAGDLGRSVGRIVARLKGYRDE